MNIITIATGGIILLYGLIILITRFTKPEQHIRLRFLKKALGDRMGNIIHSAVYIIAPFFLAYILLSHGLDGESLREIFTPPTGTP